MLFKKIKVIHHHHNNTYEKKLSIKYIAHLVHAGIVSRPSVSLMVKWWGE